MRDHEEGALRTAHRVYAPGDNSQSVNVEAGVSLVKNRQLWLEIQAQGERRHPRLYFGGASAAAERVSATEADVQLFWGEPLDGIRERIERLKALSKELDRDLRRWSLACG